METFLKNIIVFNKRVTHRGTRVRDSLFLTLVVFCSSLTYVRNLGFYSDDWAFLATWANCSIQSYWGLVTCFYGHSAASDSFRPVQALYLTLLYRMFGDHPLGYHVVNSLMIACAALVLYMALCEFGLSEFPAVAIALVYGLIPHYSTDRFWIAAAQSNVCMAFSFLSFYAAARISPVRPTRRWAWMATSILAMLASLASQASLL